MQPSSVAKPARIAWDGSAYAKDEFQQWFGVDYLTLREQSPPAIEPIEVSSVAKLAGFGPAPVTDGSAPLVDPNIALGPEEVDDNPLRGIFPTCIRCGVYEPFELLSPHF